MLCASCTVETLRRWNRVECGVTLDHPQAILEHLVVLGLADERTRRQVARILTHLMADPDCQQCKCDPYLHMPLPPSH